MEKVSHANTKHKKPGKVVLVTDKIDFKTVLLKVRRGGETFYSYKRASISGRYKYEYASA